MKSLCQVMVALAVPVFNAKNEICFTVVVHARVLRLLVAYYFFFISQKKVIEPVVSAGARILPRMDKPRA
ncbi:MAG: hypothetical protein ACI823_000859 [Chitinophagales bacterium]|jgi:hypothetical protein